MQKNNVEEKNNSRAKTIQIIKKASSEFGPEKVPNINEVTLDKL